MNETLDAKRLIIETIPKNEKPVSKMGLLLKYGIAIMIIDRWIFGPVRAAIKRKGPLIAFHNHGIRPRKKKARKKGNTAMKIFGYSLAAIAGIAIIAVLAVKVFAFGEAKVKEAASKTAAV